MKKSLLSTILLLGATALADTPPPQTSPILT